MGFKAQLRREEARRERSKKRGYSQALFDVLLLIGIRRKKLISEDGVLSWQERSALDKIDTDIRKSAYANDSYKSLRNKIKNRKLKSK